MADKNNLFAISYWLLNAATLLMFLLIGAMILGLIGMFGFAIVVGFDHIDLPIELSDLGINGAQILRIGSFALLAGLVCTLLLTFAIMLTTRIVESAMHGDPFVPENADRLTQIGWLLLGIQVAGWFITPMMAWLIPEKLADEINFNFDMSPVGLFGILLIFVLAQIFRHGTKLSADLEGTV